MIRVAGDSGSAPATWLAWSLALAGAPAAAVAGGITVDMHDPPGLLPTPSGRVLVYELNVRNFDADCARLVDVRAAGGDSLQRRYQGDAIAENALVYDAAMVPVRNPGEGESALHPVDVPPGGGAVLYFFLTLADNVPAPASLRHTLDFTACADGAPARQSVSEEGAISAAPAVVVGLPFRGQGWVAGDSVNPTGTHRRTLIPVRDASGQPIVGEFHAPERYAIDWVVVDDDAHRAIGPIDANASYLAYGREIVAVADGTVSRTRDGMPQGTPPHNPPGQTVETAAGNYIMQDIGGGHYAFYAHLQPGSLRVHEGDHVTRGQVIGLLGNSGNSSEAHLHFHVSDANDPLMSEGVPFVFDRFRATGQVDGMNETNGLFDDVVRTVPVTRLRVMPSSYSVVDADPAPPSPFEWAYPALSCRP
jgi:murein DD-endopeptidase MepM/ murein hydrolase activator NlpD